jgi:ABC-type uncharacterized transport system substrate-binding protein
MKLQQTLKTNMRILFILTMGIFLLIGCSPPAEQNEATEPTDTTESSYAGKKVLVVDSYHIGDGATDEVQAAITEVMKDTGVELEYLYMDTKRNKDEDFVANAAQEAFDKVESFEPDVLITAQDNAQRDLVVPFLMDSDLPIIFNGVNWDASVYGYPTKHITGIVEVELVDQVLGHLEQFTEGERVGYLAVDSNTEQKTVAIYQDRFFDGELQAHLVETYDEYTEMFIQLQDEVDILLIGNEAGIDRWEADEVQAFFDENTRIPTGSVRTRTAPYTLITLAKLNYEQGELAGQMALDILNGTSIADIPMTENKQGKLFLNLTLAKALDITFAPTLLRNAEVFGAE